MRRNPARPVSPHMSIWKWTPNMAVSIAHRVSGAVLGLAGPVVAAAGLLALAQGPEAFDHFLGCASSVPGTIVLILLTWALFQHLGSGLRHLYLDTGAGYDLRTNHASAVSAFVGAALATALLWGAILGGVI